MSPHTLISHYAPKIFKTTIRQARALHRVILKWPDKGWMVFFPFDVFHLASDVHIFLFAIFRAKCLCSRAVWSPSCSNALHRLILITSENDFIADFSYLTCVNFCLAKWKPLILWSLLTVKQFHGILCSITSLNFRKVRDLGGILLMTQHRKGFGFCYKLSEKLCLCSKTNRDKK